MFSAIWLSFCYDCNKKTEHGLFLPTRDWICTNWKKHPIPHITGVTYMFYKAWKRNDKKSRDKWLNIVKNHPHKYDSKFATIISRGEWTKWKRKKGGVYAF